MQGLLFQAAVTSEKGTASHEESRNFSFRCFGFFFQTDPGSEFNP